ncbi:MAG: histidine phosphatase family protein [Actinomycetota bacterium]
MSPSHRLYLIRHGEVANPNHVVYGHLPGFHLSPNGVLQAQGTAHHLTDTEIEVVISSPLARAVETASVIARRHGIEPTIDERATESHQFLHWTGHRWDSIPRLFPGELEAYLEDASRVGNDETLADVAARITAAVDDAVVDGFRTIGVVSHQDPIQATRLALTGRDLGELRDDPPAHAEVVTLIREGSGAWREHARWAPTVPVG